MQTGSGSDLISNSGSATLIVTICYLLFLLEVYASMLMISLTTFLITSPDNNVAPDINKIISVPELRSRIPTGPEPNDYSYRIQMIISTGSRCLFLPDPDPNVDWSPDHDSYHRSGSDPSQSHSRI